MGEALKKRVKQSKFESDAKEALLNIFVASNHLKTALEAVFYEYDITGSQYNVLRILKGVYPDGYPRCEIIQRMVDQSPDVTRLIDRLEKNRLVERFNSNEDRRLSIARITKKGIQLLDTLKASVDEVDSLLSNKLSKKELILLSEICEKIYDDSG